MYKSNVSKLLLLLIVSAGFALAGCASNRGYDRYDDRNYGSRGGYGCGMCGVVEDIDPIRTQAGDTAALGTIVGAVIGAAAGNQIGDGSGQKIATVGGAIAGGVIGHEVDQANDNAWRIVVRLNNGRYATVTQQQNPRVQIGDYVEVRGDRVYLR